MMKPYKCITLLCLFLSVMACATGGPKGEPTGQYTRCQDGEERQLLDCRMAYEQFVRTVRFDVGIVESAAVGFGVGAQNLIALDSTTGDLLAHSRQICVEYNNCLLTREEYRQETQYLRRAQLKIREMAGTAAMMYGTSYGPQEMPVFPPPPPELDQSSGSGTGGESENIALAELDGLSQDLRRAADRKRPERGAPGSDTPAPNPPIQLQYSFFTKDERNEKKRVSPGATLKSGNGIKFSFVSDEKSNFHLHRHHGRVAAPAGPVSC